MRLLTTVAALCTTKARNAKTLMTCTLHITFFLSLFLWIAPSNSYCVSCRLNRFGIIHLRPKRSPEAAKERNGKSHIICSKSPLVPSEFVVESSFPFLILWLLVMSWLATLDSRVRVRLATPDIIHSMLSKSLFNKQLDALLEKKAEVFFLS
jgi:hypothetical protein